jgi:hypothetical protein
VASHSSPITCWVYRTHKLAVVEAKAWDEAVTEGVAQAKNYAQKVAIRYTYATNGSKSSYNSGLRIRRRAGRRMGAGSAWFSSALAFLSAQMVTLKWIIHGKSRRHAFYRRQSTRFAPPLTAQPRREYGPASDSGASLEVRDLIIGFFNWRAT